LIPTGYGDCLTLTKKIGKTYK